MDWHVTKNRNSKNRKQSSRKYFVTAGEWLRAAETVGNDGVPAFVPSDPVPDRKEEKEITVPRMRSKQPVHYVKSHLKISTVMRLMSGCTEVQST